MQVIALNAFLLFLSWSASNTGESFPNTRAECEARRGNWLGGHSRMCLVSAMDTGKNCSDSTQCDGLCEASSKAVVGKSAQGTCSNHVREYHCYRPVSRGIVRSGPCD
jgi:hypothetical protein